MTLQRKLSVIGAIVFALMTMVGVGPASANTGTGALRNIATGMCLNTDGYNVWTENYECANRRWTWDGTRIYERSRPWNCLQSDSSGTVIVGSCSAGGATWFGGYNDSIRSNASFMCLDSNHQGRVYTLACNWGDYQRWWLDTW